MLAESQSLDDLAGGHGKGDDRTEMGKATMRQPGLRSFLHLGEGELPLAEPLQFRRLSPIRRRETATARGGSTMLRHLRTLLAALAVVGMLAAPATSAFAASDVEMIENEKASPMVDLFLMRPLGLMMLAASAALAGEQLVVTPSSGSRCTLITSSAPGTSRERTGGSGSTPVLFSAWGSRKQVPALAVPSCATPCARWSALRGLP